MTNERDKRLITENGVAARVAAIVEPVASLPDNRRAMRRIYPLDPCGHLVSHRFGYVLDAARPPQQRSPADERPHG